MLEQQIQNEILRSLATRSDCRIWRANTGGAVPIATVRAIKAALLRRDTAEALRLCDTARVLSFGVPGQADLSGLLSDGRRLEIEVKSATGRQSQEQISFEAMVRRFKGVYVLARSVEDVAAAMGAAGQDTEVSNAHPPKA